VRHCNWEDKDFTDDQFDPYRGLIYLHKTADPVHLTNGQLPDGPVEGGAGGPIGNVDISPPAPEEGPGRF
jgi:hypothetical protein